MADRTASARGFTLIEIMVALAVFSLAALALIRLETSTIRGVSMIDATAAANMVARNVAIDAATAARAPTRGTATGREANGGSVWTWTRTVAPTGNTQVLRIDVAVADRAGRVLARATLIRPPTAGALS